MTKTEARANLIERLRHETDAGYILGMEAELRQLDREIDRERYPQRWDGIPSQASTGQKRLVKGPRSRWT